MLVQEAVGGAEFTHGWRVLVASMMCVRTRREQSHPAVWRILAEFPRPGDVAVGTPRVGERLEVITRHCGFARRRTTTLIRMSKEYDGGRDPLDKMHGVGPYVSNAWRIFQLCDVLCSPDDRELRAYCAWTIRESR
jgi:endonuclease III